MLAGTLISKHMSVIIKILVQENQCVEFCVSMYYFLKKKLFFVVMEWNIITIFLIPEEERTDFVGLSICISVVRLLCRIYSELYKAKEFIFSLFFLIYLF